MPDQPTSDLPAGSKRSLKDYARIFGCGFIMGGADVVPGVSGGTMAFILGIYDELVESIRIFTTKETIQMGLKFQVKKAWDTLPWRFLVALGLGIVAAIAIFSTPIKWMLENRLALILAFFFGLVLASVITVIKRVEKWGVSRVIGLIAGTAAGWLVVGLPLLQNPPDSKLYLLLCGAIAICAMILPGISGSFMLVLLGKYDFVLNAVHEIKKGVNFSSNAVTLIIFIIGIVIGIASFVRLLSFLLKKYHDVTISVLIGFMIGSLRKVWPWKIGDDLNNGNILPQNLDGSFWFAILLAIVGCVLVLVIEYIANKHENKKVEGEEK